MNASGPFRTALPVLLLVIGLCAVVSYLTTRWALRDSSWRHDDPHGHAWLSQELDLTPEQTEAINSFDAAYRAERARRQDDFRQRIARLRDMLMTHDRFTPEVGDAIHQLHLVHGDLQELSIRHFYDMLSVLPPEKQARLRSLAGEALSEPE